jgi:hypothetical protein
MDDELERAKFLSLFMDELLAAVIRLKEDRERLDQTLAQGTTKTDDEP